MYIVNFVVQCLVSLFFITKYHFGPVRQAVFLAYKPAVADLL
jgi:hypothetical protein